MVITEIRIYLSSVADSTIRAFASVTFDGSFVVHGLKIIESRGRLFVSMPARKMPTGEFREIAHAITTELHEAIQSQVLRAYDDERHRPEHTTSASPARSDP
ncbi:MAG TPA: SpoVG family protein [Candidatus Ozemobacteraceae bacterium]|nr:SpoVG family protein [Candidatus Ozemobacteraceae bacterium]